MHINVYFVEVQRAELLKSSTLSQNLRLSRPVTSSQRNPMSSYSVSPPKNVHILRSMYAPELEKASQIYDTTSDYRVFREVKTPQKEGEERNARDGSEGRVSQAGTVNRDSWERPQKTYEELRNQKKIRDNKTHDSLINLKEDIDKLKGSFDTFKSREKDPAMTKSVVKDKDLGMAPNRKNLELEDSFEYRQSAQQAENPRNKGKYNNKPSEDSKTAGPTSRDDHQYSSMQDFKVVKNKNEPNKFPNKSPSMPPNMPNADRMKQTNYKVIFY